MRLSILLFLIISFAFAVTVVINPYDGIDYDEPNTYTFEDQPVESNQRCFCYDEY